MPLVKYPHGKATGDYTGGRPRHAENEELPDTSVKCGARMQECTVELAGPARNAD